MKLISLNTGRPKPYTYKGRQGFTSIFKTPVEGVRKVSRLNVEGDEQSDLTVHGGELKAVYAYDVSYYQRWKTLLDRNDWGYGLFGENLTTDGLTDDAVYIGSIYQVGSVLLQAVQPRFPCFKLNIRFGIDDMLQRFMQQPMHGIYFSVLEEGELQAGDDINLVQESKSRISVQQVVETYYSKGEDEQVLDEIISIEILPERLRKAFESFK